MSRLGAYYPTQLLDPIQGLGEVSSQASLAHETIRRYLKGPSGNYAPWATQGPTSWTPILEPEFNYRAFPINASTLRRVEAESFSNPVGLVAAVYAQPLSLHQAEMLYSSGPYVLSHGEAIYRLDDGSEPPRPWFVYWGALANEGDKDIYGSYEDLERAIVQSGGEFVFILPDERTGNERPHPTVDVTTYLPALTSQQVEEQPVPSPVVQPSPAPVQQASSAPSMWVLGGVGIFAAYLGYSLVRR